MSGASAQPTAASTYSPMPVSRMGRRPQRSDSGPHSSCEPPKASSSAVKVVWVWATLAPSCSVSRGRAGRYRSVVSGCRPSSRASMAMTNTGDMAARAAA